MKKTRHLNATGKGEIIYDYKYDILTFKVADREYKNSFEFQNFVADIDKKDFVTGIRIFDVSKVFGITKHILRNIVHCDFKARVENNIITITFKFIGKLRNKIIPIFTEKESFTQQITTPINSHHPLDDSLVECPIEVPRR